MPLTDIEKSLITGEDVLPRTIPPSKRWRAVWSPVRRIREDVNPDPWYDKVPPQWLDYAQGLVVAGPVCPSAEIAEQLAAKKLAKVLARKPNWGPRPVDYVETTPEGDPIASH